MPTPKDRMLKLLRGMIKTDASDLHLKVGYSPYYRIASELRKVNMPPIASDEEMHEMIEPLVPPQRRGDYDQKGDLDFAWQDPQQGERYRIDVYRSMGLMHAAIRRVKSTIPSFEELHLPPVYEQTIARTYEGLIIVSGVTGSGKSTTLAALLDYINTHHNMHVITIEDPIEYVFKPKKSIISQREIGLDVPDYNQALKYVVRQDPDVVFIGEMRDASTMLAALQAAETGHLVLGSLHTADAPGAFARILEYFPRSQHEFIRSSLAASLVAIMCQRLVPAIDEKVGRVPATEVLLANPTVRDKIRHEEDEDLADVINGSIQEGMRSFTYSLAELVEKELVYFDTAMEYAPNREQLKSAVAGIKASAQTLVHRIRHGSRSG